MAKLSLSIKTCLAVLVLVMPFCVGCGGGTPSVPKAESKGPEPQRVSRGVQGAGEGGAAPLKD